jgi:cysteine desulfuration protein SufE
VDLNSKLAALVDDFAPIDDAHERLSLAVDRARRHPPEPAIRTDENRVAGCVSSVWLTAEPRDGLLFFHADADSPLVRGLVLLLTDFFSGAPAAAIAASEADPLGALDLARNLSPTRQNGLAAVRARIRALSQGAAR